MTAESFLKLKEFDSLEKMKLHHQKQIQEQEERLSLLNNKKQEKLNSQKQLLNDLHALEQQYFESEKKLKTAEAQASGLRDIGADESKIQQFQSDAAKLENELFGLLEQTEQIQQELNEAKTFLSGLEKTILEIDTEVSGEREEHQKAIAQLDLRLVLIKEELPTDFREALEKTLKKKLAIGPFTRIENGSCYFCRYKISRVEESEIDMQKMLKHCPQCTRIFLPYGAS